MGEHHIWGQKHIWTLLGGQRRYFVNKLELLLLYMFIIYVYFILTFFYVTSFSKKRNQNEALST